MPQDRKRQIIEATCQLIAQKGFEGLRTREIADRVGVNHATLHYHFKDKEVLIAAVVKEITDQIYQADTALVFEQTDSPRERLRLVFHNHLRQRQEHPERFIVMNEIALRASRTPAIAPILIAHEKDTYARMQAFIEAGVNHGDFRPTLDTQRIAVMLITFWRGMRVQLSQADIDQYLQIYQQIEQDMLASV